MMKFSLALFAVLLSVSFSFAGNCTAGGVQVVQSVPVVQTTLVQQVAAPVIATVVVPQVQQVQFLQQQAFAVQHVQHVQQFQQVQAVNVVGVRQFSRGQNFGGGGNRQVGLFNVNGSRGGFGAAGVGGGNRQFGLINISR